VGAKCALLACTVVMTACATTVDDTGSSTGTADVADVPVGAEPALESGSPIDSGTIVDPDAPTPTAALTGSAADLLPELSVEMSRLGSQIAEGGDKDETLERIEQIWDQIRPEIEAERPELLNGLGATIEMAQIAVERKQPADADKAFALLTDLVDRFLTG
jgi:hypothetical protein